jgi:regulator of cell morphogenesis and NO signaling
METLQTLDVRIIEPRFKHYTIFKTFDELENNESFVIVNDHDPKPLYYQLMAERPGTFGWEYQMNGPVEWRVKISKQQKEKGKEKTIGQLAAEDYKKALVFKKLGIDFCCGGKKTLSEAAREKGLNVQQIEDEFKSIPDNKSDNNKDFLAWSTSELVNHILEYHHNYVKKTLPEMTQILSKVVGVHSDDHPELFEVSKNFVSMASGLMEHMEKEENILFPYINTLEKLVKKNAPQGPILREAIRAMEDDHQSVAFYFDKIREATNEYKIPQGACNSFRILYISLNEFEQDLKQHVHLENNILFPKAIDLESEILR